MAKQYYFKDGNETFIPVADGDFFTENMDSGYSLGECIIQFYDETETPVTPSAGTITFSGMPIDGQYHEPSNGTGIIDATTVIAGDATYEMPEFNGPCIRGRMNLSGVTGASLVRAYHWRDE